MPQTSHKFAHDEVPWMNIIRNTLVCTCEAIRSFFIIHIPPALKMSSLFPLRLSLFNFWSHSVVRQERNLYHSRALDTVLSTSTWILQVPCCSFSSLSFFLYVSRETVILDLSSVHQSLLSIRRLILPFSDGPLFFSLHNPWQSIFPVAELPSLFSVNYAKIKRICFSRPLVPSQLGPRTYAGPSLHLSPYSDSYSSNPTTCLAWIGFSDSPTRTAWDWVIRPVIPMIDSGWTSCADNFQFSGSHPYCFNPLLSYRYLRVDKSWTSRAVKKKTVKRRFQLATGCPLMRHADK